MDAFTGKDFLLLLLGVNSLLCFLPLVSRPSFLNDDVNIDSALAQATSHEYYGNCLTINIAFSLYMLLDVSSDLVSMIHEKEVLSKKDYVLSHLSKVSPVNDSTVDKIKARYDDTKPISSSFRNSHRSQSSRSSGDDEGEGRMGTEMMDTNEENMIEEAERDIQDEIVVADSDKYVSQSPEFEIFLRSVLILSIFFPN